jgi:hypothetical protein
MRLRGKRAIVTGAVYGIGERYRGLEEEATFRYSRQSKM